MTDVGVRAEDGGVCSYCGEYYEQMGVVISWTDSIDSLRDEVRRICVKCLIEAFDRVMLPVAKI